MRLEKLVLHGFKSFADKTEFTFPNQFTAVVGPNGSGKSNVSDAIRWVMGEQSMKLLRTKQSADLIFGGSAKLSKMGMAQVEMHLDNADGKFPLDYPEVVLSRKLFRSGESEYRINGAKVRLSDVVMMLAKANFGQKSYAVIGQGMITQFLNATPQERKLFFDEATGVREYQIKRDQAINKLIRTEENLHQSDTLLAEIEPHLKSLERLVKRLEKREKIETELRDVQLRYFGSVWKDLHDRKQKLQSQIAEQQQTIDALTKEITDFQAKSDVMAGEASRGERYEQLQQDFNQLLEQKSQLLKEQAVLKAKLEVEHERQGKLSLVWLERKASEISSDMNRLQSEKQQFTDSIAQKQAVAKRLETQLAGSNKELTAEADAISALKQQISDSRHTMTIPEVRTELHAMFSEQEGFLRSLLDTSSLDEFAQRQKEAKRITKKLADLLDRLSDEERAELAGLQTQLQQKEVAVRQLTSERERLQTESNSTAVHIATAESQLALVERNLERLASEAKTVASDIAAAEAEAADDNADKMQAQYQAGIVEFDGQLAELETAISAARSGIDAFNQAEDEKKNQLLEWQQQLRTLQRQLNNAQQVANNTTVEIAKIDTRVEDVRHEIQREVLEELHEAIFAYNASEAVDPQLENTMVRLQRQLAAIGEVDDATMQEYTDTKERYDFLHGQITDLQASIDGLETVIEELDVTIKSQFQKNFKVINDDFEKYFAVLFGGGNAKLQLLTEEPQDEETTDDAEPQSIGRRKKNQKLISGIDILAHPPGKKVQHTASLSGGEKSLVSIALLCAIIANNPAPFVVLDEVEAALDEENSEKLAAIIKQLSSKTQIVIITHNRVTMRAADILYGVTASDEGKSHILSVDLSDAEELTAE